MRLINFNFKRMIKFQLSLKSIHNQFFVVKIKIYVLITLALILFIISSIRTVGVPRYEDLNTINYWLFYPYLLIYNYILCISHLVNLIVQPINGVYLGYSLLIILYLVLKSKKNYYFYLFCSLYFISYFILFYVNNKEMFNDLFSLFE